VPLAWAKAHFFVPWPESLAKMKEQQRVNSPSMEQALNYLEEKWGSFCKILKIKSFWNVSGMTLRSVAKTSEFPGKKSGPGLNMLYRLLA
jgi:hypothetical protein